MADADDDFGAWGHGPHRHRVDLFVAAATGTATIIAAGAMYPVSTTRGVWVPAGVTHSALFDPGYAPLAYFLPTPGDFTAEPVSLAIDESLRLAVLAAVLDDADLTDTFRALLTEGQPGALLRVAGLELTGPVAAPIADALRRDPADSRSVDDWAARLHTSPATIRRAFAREAGVPFSDFRLALRLERAVALLAQGRAVGSVAKSVGMSHSGLIAAFRRHLACAPSSFRGGAAA